MDKRIDRRTFLKGAGALGAGSLAASVLPTSPALAREGARPAASTPLQHIIIDCQENRSFDHYFGFAPFAGQYGVPPGYSQPDGQGGSVTNNEASGGQPAGPPAPPRDGLAAVGNLLECFEF